jgi:phospholipid/cholesterol/gamma-HCH transport system substrate-binding protein
MPRTQQLRLSQLRVGLLVLAALVILILTIFAFSGDLHIPWISKTSIVKTQMASVDGLSKGAEVRLSGKRIGSVRDIRFGDIPPDTNMQARNIEIEMELDGKLDGKPAIERIRTDSLAVLKSAGVLGDNVIDITPGTAKGQPIADGGTINSRAQKSVGDIINASQTAVGNLNEISEDIKELTENLKAGKGTAGKFLSDEAFYLDLDRAVREAESLMQDIKSGEGTVGRLVSDPALYNQTNETITRLRSITDQVGDQLSAGRGTIGKLFKDEEIYNQFNSVVARLDKTSQRLERTMEKIEKGEGTVGKLINDEKIYNDARDTIEKLRIISTRLEKGEGSAGLLLRDEKLYNNVNNVSGEITKLLYDFRQNPKKYLSVKVTIF